MIAKTRDLSGREIGKLLRVQLERGGSLAEGEVLQGRLVGVRHTTTEDGGIETEITMHAFGGTLTAMVVDQQTGAWVVQE